MKGILRFVLATVAVLGIGGIVVQHGFAQQGVAQQSSKVVAIHAGHLLDVKSGKLLSDQTIVIEDGKIARVGPSAEIKAPADAMLIDLSNATVLPGLIDAHTHLTWDPISAAF
jgi:imidazolonepropionase-like amidohydrolase